MVAVRSDRGGLVGLMPLVLSQRRHFPTLSFAGAEYGDYYQPVARSQAEEETVAREFAKDARRAKKEWAIIVADYVDEDAPWTRALACSNAVSLKAIRYHEHPSVYLSIPLRHLTWDEYLAGRSRNLRSQLGRKRARSSGWARPLPSRQRRPRERDEDALRPPREALGRQRKHDLQLATRTRVPPRVRPRRAGARLASPLVPRCGRKPDRSLVRLEHRRPVPLLPGGVRSGVVPREPRALLLAHTIEAAFDEGASEYDMLLGNEPFKERLATAAKERRTLVLVRPAHPARAFVLADVALRRLGHRLPMPIHDRVRRAVDPLLRRWPVETAP